MTDIRFYTDATGRAPFEEWLNAMKDTQGRARIRARLARLQAGNFGDCKPLRDGVQDLHAQARELFDRTLLEAAVERSEGHRGDAASALGLGRNTVTRKLGPSRRRR